MDCKVNPGRSVETDRLYLPGETLELDAVEAKKLKKRDIITIVNEKATPAAGTKKTESTTGSKKTTPSAGSGKPARLNAPDSIKLAKGAETIEALGKLAEGEDRTTVIDAIAKRRDELTKAE